MGSLAFEGPVVVHEIIPDNDGYKGDVGSNHVARPGHDREQPRDPEIERRRRSSYQKVTSDHSRAEARRLARPNRHIKLGPKDTGQSHSLQYTLAGERAAQPELTEKFRYQGQVQSAYMTLPQRKASLSELRLGGLRCQQVNVPGLDYRLVIHRRTSSMTPGRNAILEAISRKLYFCGVDRISTPLGLMIRPI